MKYNIQKYLKQIFIFLWNVLTKLNFLCFYKKITEEKKKYKISS